MVQRTHRSRSFALLDFLGGFSRKLTLRRPVILFGELRRGHDLCDCDLLNYLINIADYPIDTDSRRPYIRDVRGEKRHREVHDLHGHRVLLILSLRRLVHEFAGYLLGQIHYD